VKLGWVFPQNEIGIDPDDIVRLAQAIERRGYSYLDVFDHVLGADTSARPDWPGPYTHTHEFHEPFVLYGFLAGQTALELATGVLVLPQRQTALVAKQAAELDLLSRGRLRLGVGIGWNPVEAEALGTTFADRAARYEEQILLLRRLWTEPVVSVDSPHHRIDRAGLAPLPVQRPIPIWLGGGTAPVVLERVGRLADGWIAHEPRSGQTLQAAITVIRAAADRAGRDPAAVGVQGRIDIHGRFDRGRFEQSYTAWKEAGVDHLSINAVGQGRGLAPHLDVLEAVSSVLGSDLERHAPEEGPL
jgi:probable F420-dependent oxidoreductase